MVALVMTARAKSKVSLPALIAVVLMGTLIAATKPPYLPLALAALAALWWAGPRPAKVNLMFAAALIVMVSVPVLWLKLSNAGTVNYNAQFHTDAAAQSAFLLSHPFAVAELAFSTLRILGKAYWVQMIGILGWQDAPLHPAAVSILGFGLIAILALDGTSAKPLRWVFSSQALPRWRLSLRAYTWRGIRYSRAVPSWVCRGATFCRSCHLGRS